MSTRSNEPFLWVLFSAGGVVASFLVPAVFFLYGLAFPLGWFEPPDYQSTLHLVRPWPVRLLLFVLCSLPLFHWAHRFRFTLYDGLQIKHLNEVITVFCYGGAIAGTVVASYLLWRIP